MPHPHPVSDASSTLPAGDFSAWLGQARHALLHGGGTDVECGTCTACCSSSYFIHIRPEETDALAHIGPDGLVPASGMPQGHMLMGYDQEGLCPQMHQGKCAVYAHRPQTCRSYDCRVFAAAETTAGPDKPKINLRVEQWRFAYPTARDREDHQAVGAASKFIRENAAAFPGGRIPEDPSQLAITALKVYGVFLPGGKGVDPEASPQEIAAAIVETSREFGARP
jgi:Fe-S-cluster containining protein